jgi:hypothetical protein
MIKFMLTGLAIVAGLDQNYLLAILLVMALIVQD